MLAKYNPNPDAPLVSVKEILYMHWAKYGRDIYCRYDYDEVEKESADGMMNALRAMEGKGKVDTGVAGRFASAVVDDFAYEDGLLGLCGKILVS